MTKRLWIMTAAGVLLISNAYFGVRYGILSRDLAVAEAEISGFRTNEKVLNFTRMFIDKVLKADGEVDFDTRLGLENAVREIKDDEILAQWDKFVKSKTEMEAQNEVKDLLDLLVSRIQ